MNFDESIRGGKKISCLFVLITNEFLLVVIIVIVNVVVMLLIGHSAVKLGRGFDAH